MPINFLTVVRRVTRRMLIVCGAVLAMLSGCAAPFNYDALDAPVPLESVPLQTPAPRVALVLGAGGPRGYAHIGVMRVLEEACIDVDLIVGTSVGSLLGAFWASGLSATEIDERSMEGGPLTLFDPSLFADRGWIHGRKLQKYVNRELGGKRLEELPRQVIVVTTHREEKTPRYFIQGNTGVAVRASSAVPGVISPVGINGIEYEDGDVVMPLAVSAARSAGAEFVIAVNVYPKTSSLPANVSDRLRATVERRERQTQAEIGFADFVIHAETHYDAGPSRAYFEESRDIGEQVARERLVDLVSELKQNGIEMRGANCV
ncbi:MAG: patatin-like phospholipase family protein [Pseudomonadota bacterium]